ncbi:MAG: DNA-3-methyladenine glycosylase 2 family protein, partial [Chitinophagia bacterium]|nr:DNA-3-methyladenine glycosylase 2 family protein [Chitinophagia bacterium]
MSFLQFNPDNFNSFCDILAKRDKDLKQIIQKHG